MTDDIPTRSSTTRSSTTPPRPGRGPRRRGGPQPPAPLRSPAVPWADGEAQAQEAHAHEAHANEAQAHEARRCDAQDRGAPNRADRDGAPLVPVFDPVEAGREILKLTGGPDRILHDPDAGLDILLEGEPDGDLAPEDRLRLRRLRELFRDPRRGRRKPLLATPAMAAAIDALADEAPAFREAVRLAADAAALSLRSRRPFALPPLLLLGPPGVGKSFFAARLAAAFAARVETFAMNAHGAFGQIAGLAPVWKGAGPGRLAEALVRGDCAAPVLLFDELDKARAAHPDDRPLDLLLSLWEPENARALRDDYYRVAFDARGAVSLATANSLDGLPPALADRLLVLPIAPPSPDDRRRMARAVFRSLAAPHSAWLASEPAPNVLDRLARLHPRRMRLVLALAIARAAAEARDAVDPQDLDDAQALLDRAHAKPSMTIGFLADHGGRRGEMATPPGSPSTPERE